MSPLWPPGARAHCDILTKALLTTDTELQRESPRAEGPIQASPSVCRRGQWSPQYCREGG